MFFGNGNDHVQVIYFGKFIDAIFYILVLDKMILRIDIFQRCLKQDNLRLGITFRMVIFRIHIQDMKIGLQFFYKSLDHRNRSSFQYFAKIAGKSDSFNTNAIFFANRNAYNRLGKMPDNR